MSKQLGSSAAFVKPGLGVANTAFGVAAPVAPGFYILCLAELNRVSVIYHDARYSLTRCGSRGGWWKCPRRSCPPIPSGLRPPTGIAALHAENAVTLAEGKHLGAVPGSFRLSRESQKCIVSRFPATCPSAGLGPEQRLRAAIRDAPRDRDANPRDPHQAPQRRTDGYRLDASQRRDPGRTQENDNIERLKRSITLMEDLDFVTRLERSGQTADEAEPVRKPIVLYRPITKVFGAAPELGRSILAAGQPRSCRPPTDRGCRVAIQGAAAHCQIRRPRPGPRCWR